MSIADEAIERKVISALRKLMMRKDISLEQTMVELDVDSILALEIVMQLERDFNINIPDDQIEHMRTVRDAVELVRALCVVQA